jgi:bleomycin hydrolase
MAKYLGIVLFFISVCCVRAQTNVPVTIKQITAGTIKSQGNTNTCWSFSTTSMIESEQIQNQQKNIDISELYTARNLFIEKAKRIFYQMAPHCLRLGACRMMLCMG